MSAPFQHLIEKATFCAWVERQEGKYEWKEGRVVQTTNVTRAHVVIVANLLRALSARLDLESWSVVASDFGVEDEDFIRYPDVLIEPAGADPKSRHSEKVTALFEVLSPSTAGTDLSIKPEEYMRFASLELYAVVTQDEPILWVWQRNAERRFPSRPIQISGRDAALEITSLGLALPLSEVYRGIR